MGVNQLSDGELPLSFLYSLPKDSQSEMEHLYIRQASLATLYFGRFSSSESEKKQDLRKAEVLLQLSLESIHSLPNYASLHKADIQNSRATVFEAQGTITALEQAVELRLELGDEIPGKFDLDLAYTALHLYTLKLDGGPGKKVEPPVIMSTRSRALMIANRER